ncbi:MAG: beta-glucanase (GH16 family) [Chitinophagales bacterium]|jgi:beta-glucanase (GH16 family)
MRYSNQTKFMKDLFQSGAILTVLLFFSACDKDNTQNLPERDYSLIWSEEFEGNAGESLDSTIWTYDIGTGDNGWGNAELQYYRDSPDNVSLDGDGNLAITARNQSFGSSPFTSGRIKTKNQFSTKFGRIEANIKLPYGPGVWPAFWMLGDNIDNVGWPQCGEIDIMEARGQLPSITNGTIHGPGYAAGASIGEAYSLGNDRFDKDFHIFAIEWGEDYIDFFVDDFRYNRITADEVPGEWVYNKSFYMLLNVAVGGGFVGFPTSGTPFPQTLLVDYIRVYQEQ